MKASTISGDADEDAESMSLISTTAHPTNQRRQSASRTSIIYALVFFSCMIVMELTLEGTQKAFPDLPALAGVVTLSQFTCCFLLPVVVSRGETLEDLPKSTSEIMPYVVLSLCVFGSSGLATMSIRYVSYPTKVVIKSTKLIPTMIVSTLLQNGQRYSRMEYLAACLLCAGAAGYGFGEGTGKGGNQQDGSYLGILLLSISVFSDAFTPNIQQRLMAPLSNSQHDTTATARQSVSHVSQWCRWMQRLVLPPGGGGLGVSASTLMTNANFVGGIGIFCYMALTGDLMDAIGVAFVERRLFLFLITIGMSLAVAVFAYTRLIKDSGSVVAVGVATLRKVVTVTLSYLVYPKPFTMTHAISSVLVLGGVLLSSYAKQQGGNIKKHGSVELRR